MVSGGIELAMMIQKQETKVETRDEPNGEGEEYLYICPGNHPTASFKWLTWSLS